jgi:hypothetical protein
VFVNEPDAKETIISEQSESSFLPLLKDADES